MKENLTKAPSRWGDDSLTQYLDACRQNQYATFANHRPEVSDLIELDRLFERFLLGAINPRPFVPMGFYLRAHSAYRSSVGAVMSGQLYEAQALLRLCLEHGAYGFYIGSDNERWERWMGRNESSAKKEMVRKEFSHGKIKRYIQDSSPKLGEHFVKLYDSFIDFGAHPNEQGFSLNSAIRKDGGNVHFDTIYLQGDGIALKVGLKTTVWVGIWVLQIAQLLYSERFQILGIRDDLDKVRFRY